MTDGLNKANACYLIEYHGRASQTDRSAKTEI